MKSEVLNGKLYCLIGSLEKKCQDYRKCSAAGNTPLASGQQQGLIDINNLAVSLLAIYEQETSSDAKAMALLTVMDAFEICRSEATLQLVLSLAEVLLPVLSDTPLKCKLLSYCYYYVEEPGCALEVRRIIESWDQYSYNTEMAEAKRCYDELI